MERLHARATLVLSSVIAGLGIVLLVESALAGGGSVGLVLGSLFVVAGGLRLFLLRRM